MPKEEQMKTMSQPNNAESKSPIAKLYVKLHTEVVINQKRESLQAKVKEDQLGGECKEDPSSEKETIRIPVEELKIAYFNDQRYWKSINLNEADTKTEGFKVGAELLQVNWFEVTGTMDVAKLRAAKPKTYQIYYIMKFRVDAFGWHSAPTKSTVRVASAAGGGKAIINQSMPLVLEELYRKRPNVWHEVPGAIFRVSPNMVGNVVEFGMSDIGSDWWKGGMVLAGIVFKPLTNPCQEKKMKLSFNSITTATSIST